MRVALLAADGGHICTTASNCLPMPQRALKWNHPLKLSFVFNVR